MSTLQGKYPTPKLFNVQMGHTENREPERGDTSCLEINFLVNSTKLNYNTRSTGYVQSESKSIHEMTQLVVGKGQQARKGLSVFSKMLNVILEIRDVARGGS